MEGEKGLYFGFGLVCLSACRRPFSLARDNYRLERERERKERGRASHLQLRDYSDYMTQPYDVVCLSIVTQVMLTQS